MRLAPSILSFDLARAADFLPEMADVGADVIHLDVMDGQFVPPITFGDAYVRSIRPMVDTPFEAHLMTLSPERHFEAFVAAGCQRIIFHAEATIHIHRHIQTLHSMGVGAGLAINPSTPVEAVLPVLPELEMVLVMTVNPGWGGQKFLPHALEKVRRLREARSDVLIEIDGGVDPTTIRSGVEAGVDLFVVGSYLAKSADMHGAVATLVAACG